MKVGEKIKQHRESQGLTQTALAKKAGISQPHLWEIEKGGRTPSLRVLGQIAEALGVKMGELLDE